MIEYICKWPEFHTFIGWFPVQELVRCKDCEHADESESGALFCHGYLVESWGWYNDMPSNGVKVEPDDFCAWSTRKERIEQ